MACTGQPSIAVWISASPAPSGLKHSDLPEALKRNTSGQRLMQRPQLMHASWSTTSFFAISGSP